MMNNKQAIRTLLEGRPPADSSEESIKKLYACIQKANEVKTGLRSIDLGEELNGQLGSDFDTAWQYADNLAGRLSTIVNAIMRDKKRINREHTPPAES